MVDFPVLSFVLKSVLGGPYGYVMYVMLLKCRKNVF